MTRNRLIAAVATVVVAVGAWLWFRSRGDDAPAYRFATVERGDVAATVSATGNLSAVTTVQVGTQVSGQVSAIYVDFNDRVKEGQLLARIDPTLQQQAVREAQAGLSRAQAQFDAAKREYDRNKALFDERIVTAAEFNAIDADYQVARANLTSAQIALDRARQNLSYTSIHSPIDGVIVERNVDVGQTVAASLSAPQLFLIANDLSEMQILASVDESDIGMIEEGQPVRFTVQAYPNESFRGTVDQVRLQSTTTENVVNYTAVVAVQNPEEKLLPGMTATVDFLTGEAQDALTVPNAALRFRPTAEMIAAVGGGAAAREVAGSGRRRGAEIAGGGSAGGSVATGDSAASRAPGAGGASGSGATTGRAPGSGASGSATRSATGATPTGMATLWYVDERGNLGTIRVRTGLSDGQRTVVQGEGLRDGMRIIVGVTGGGTAAETGASNPLQPQGNGPRRPGGF